MRSTILLLCIASVLAVCGEAAAQPFAKSKREICRFPRANDPGKVVGYDAGFSIVHNGSNYWLFGDTGIDCDQGTSSSCAGDGVYNPSEDLTSFGTIVAKTNDTSPTSCIDLASYHTGGPRNVPVSVINPTPPELCLWPKGGVSVNGSMYFYYERGKGVVSGLPNSTGLAELSENLTATRLPGLMWEYPPHFGSYPVVSVEGVGCSVTTWVYSFAVSADLFHLYATRVAAANIADVSKYEYWNGPGIGWRDAASGGLSSLVPIFSNRTDEFGLWHMSNGGASIAYNTEFERWVAIYSCHLGATICARWTTTFGPGAKITDPWAPEVALHRCNNDIDQVIVDPDHPVCLVNPQDPDCPTVLESTCRQAIQHPQFADGTKIYVTASRAKDGSRNYSTILREFDLSLTLDPKLSFPDSAADYVEEIQGANGWTYLQANSGFSNLTWSSFLGSWIGTQTWAGLPAPLLQWVSAAPGPTARAVRQWEAPSNGTLRISGEAILMRNCGDGARFQIRQLRGGMLVGVHQNRALTNSNRSFIYDKAGIDVQAGDNFHFRTLADGADPECDAIYFSPTLNFRAD